jgi:hypothetical protein
VAPFAPEVLDHNIVYTYNYYLIVGQLDFIRRTAICLDENNDRRHYNFANDRNHFYYKGITDKGYPTGGCLDFDFGIGSELKSPPLFFCKNDFKKITLKACFEGEIRGDVVLNLYEGLDEKHWGKTREFSIPFAINGNGEVALHDIDISSAPDCFIGFSLRFSTEGHISVYYLDLI